MDLAEAKASVIRAVDERAELLLDVSHRIHEHPELGYEEVFAHDLLTEVIAEEGLAVEPHAFGLPTAFAARAGTGGPTITVCCEYDALPGIGHACGHNIIAAAGLGAGLAAATIADAAGGRVVILGTPAEEGGGGKVRLIDAGAFEGVDAALMVHPANGDLTSMNVIAVHRVLVTYHGEAAHAAAFPHKGRNALDAAVLGYMNIAALRQHIRPAERIHGIFTEAGDKPNIVPARAAAEWYVRAADLRRLEALEQRVVACLQAGADAAGCTVEFEWQEPVYADMRDNEPMIERYAANAGELGRGLVLGGGQHRHGQRQLRGAEHPPHDRGVAAARLDPHARVRGLRRRPRGRRRGARRGQGDGHDDRRPVARTGRPRPGQGRFRAIRGGAGVTFYSRRS